MIVMGLSIDFCKGTVKSSSGARQVLALGEGLGVRVSASSRELTSETVGACPGKRQGQVKEFLDLALSGGAGDENRTRIISLED